MGAFMLLPLVLILYEIASLILPLKMPLWGRLLCWLFLLIGISKGFLYHRTPDGFEIYEIPYAATLLIPFVFNFIIIAALENFFAPSVPAFLRRSFCLQRGIFSDFIRNI